MSAIWVYMTAGSMEEARKVGAALIEDKLAACVNAIDGMKSMYWWDGEVQEDAEVVLIAKTTRDLLDELTARVKQVHSYDVPCIVALPIEGGNRDFIDWIGEVTK